MGVSLFCFIELLKDIYYSAVAEPSLFEQTSDCSLPKGHTNTKIVARSQTTKIHLAGYLVICLFG